jgi:hypothetical protein
MVGWYVKMREVDYLKKYFALDFLMIDDFLK